MSARTGAGSSAAQAASAALRDWRGAMPCRRSPGEHLGSDGLTGQAAGEQRAGIAGRLLVVGAGRDSVALRADDGGGFEGQEAGVVPISGRCRGRRGRGGRL